ncbi:MAG TPA: inorganic phosphate transporter [Anaerolineales bacterium]
MLASLSFSRHPADLYGKSFFIAFHVSAYDCTTVTLTYGYLKIFAVPFWVIIICAAAIALGTAIGGWRLIKTLGGKMFKIRPIDGFTSQLASAIIIIGASLIGGPVSTTQVVSATIMGAGTAERANKVRWGVAQEIAMAWLLTIPATAVLAAGIYWLILRIAV